MVDVSRPAGLPQFRRPPLDEVVLDMQFQPIPGLKLPHIGAFWRQIADEYPSVDTAPPLPSVAGTFAIDVATGLPLPRSWLLSADKTMLCQIQLDRFIFNWRRINSSAYPRFEFVSAAFHKARTQFSEFIEKTVGVKLAPTSLELTYTNHLIFGQDYQGESSGIRAFPCVPWAQPESRFIGKPKAVSWNSIFPLTETSGELTAQARHGTRNSDKSPMLVFDISAKSSAEGKNDLQIVEWYVAARSAIVQTFDDLTLQASKEKWGPYE